LVLGQRVRGLGVEQAAARQQTHHPLGGALDELLDVGVAGRVHRHEGGGARRRGDPDAVGDQNVEMRMEVEGRAVPLQHTDRPAAALAGAGLVALPGEDDVQEDGEHGAQEGAIPGEAIAQREGEAEDPLAYGDVGQDAVHQVGGGVGHAATEAGGVEAAMHPPMTARQRRRG
jgi:hypothetical protein